jgi:hypothetical protein
MQVTFRFASANRNLQNANGCNQYTFMLPFSCIFRLGFYDTSYCIVLSATRLEIALTDSYKLVKDVCSPVFYSRGLFCYNYSPHTLAVTSYRTKKKSRKYIYHCQRQHTATNGTPKKEEYKTNCIIIHHFKITLTRIQLGLYI